MKRKTTILLFSLAALVASAQPGGDRDSDRGKERMERQAREMAKDLELTGNDATWFTNLYIEYQTELRNIRRAAMERMPRPKKGKNADDADNENGLRMKEKEMKKLTDEEADKLILGSFDQTEKELAVKRAYYPRFREKLPPQKLIRLFVRMGGPRGAQNRGGRGDFPGGFGGFPPPPMGGPGGF